MVFFLSRSRFNTGLVILYRVLDDSICLSNSYIYIYRLHWVLVGAFREQALPSNCREWGFYGGFAG